MAWKRKDAREFLLQDQARGKRRARPDPDVIDDYRRRRLDIKILLRITDEKEFLRELDKVIRDYELCIEPEERDRILLIWRENR